MLNVSPRNVATAQAIEGEIKALGERRGNPEKLSDDTKLIRQDFAELNGKRTDEIGDRRGGDRKSKGKILPNDPHEGKRTDEIAAQQSGLVE